jgi:hypothetical protein
VRPRAVNLDCGRRQWRFLVPAIHSGHWAILPGKAARAVLASPYTGPMPPIPAVAGILGADMLREGGEPVGDDCASSFCNAFAFINGHAVGVPRREDSA